MAARDGSKSTKWETNVQLEGEEGRRYGRTGEEIRAN